MDSGDTVGNNDRSNLELPLDVLEKLLSHTEEENTRLRSETSRMKAALLDRVPPEYSLLKQRRDALEKKMTSLQTEKQHLVMEHMLPTRRKDRKVLALLLPSPPSSLLSLLPA